MVWFAPSVRAVALSQSPPTPNTQELSRLVVRVAVGAPGFALPVPVLPIAPAPPMPEGSAPVNVTTVIDAATLCEIVAVTEAPESAAGANARQTSAVPS